jgi:hypothetical protein
MHKEGYTTMGSREEAVAARIRRGIEHWRVHHEDIVRVDEDFYRVPSDSRGGVLRSVHIDEGNERCTCEDYRKFGRRYRLCRHIVAALIEDAKSPTYRVLKRHDSRRQAVLYVLVERRAGTERELLVSESCAEAYETKWAVESGEEAA